MFSLTFSNSVKPLHSVVAHQIRLFSRDRSFPNKLQHYLYRANLIDSIRLSLRSTEANLTPLLNHRLLDSFSPSLSSGPSQISYEAETLHAFATVLAKFHRSSQLKSLIGVINAGKFGHVQFSFMKFQVLEEYGHMNPPRCMCGGCNSENEYGRSVDVLWHTECLWCDACHSPQTNSCPRGKFHNACYERYCYVCKEKKMKKFRQHPFWEERYCPAYESDGTPKCFSCERLEVLGHMWLESQTYAPIDATEAVASSSSASSTHIPAATTSKKGACSDFEKKLVDFCKNQIETDDSPVYGVGFRKVNKMVSNSSLKETLEIIHPGLTLSNHYQTYAPIDATEASSSHTPAATASKTGSCSDFEKKLVDFCKNQIETDDSPVYGQWRSQKKILGGLWCHWCTLGAHVLGEVLPRSGRLKPRLRGSLAKAVSLKRSVKIAAVEDTVLRLTGW
ncbi:hypothetical protein F2Q69_00055035 [Brassica cretica]|uniref:Protein DA1-like domain-containing protein n=1 Tax=Brassica cretica TaxID=69181 RepID=A0A8S9N5A8_BRACR|nr:hypothetical protein F2Q69_00055035 [Brassica cretica]